MYIIYLIVVLVASVIGAISAVVGGLVGTKINRKLTSKKILLIYTLTMITIIGINIYNVISNLILLFG